MAISIPRVNTCCGCVPLQTGAKIFSFISLVGCITIVILSGWEMSMIRKHYPNETEAIVMLAVDIGVQLVQAGTSVLLLQGAIQERPKLVLPWLASTVVIMVMEVFFMSSLYNRYNHIVGYEETDWMLTTFTFLLDDIYGLLVVYSYYKSLAP